MSIKVKPENYYADSIIEDLRERFVNDETIQFGEEYIERQYEFEDGAVVKYEWQDAPKDKDGGEFNHKFTLIKLPKPNPHKLKKGVLKQIDYS